MCVAMSRATGLVVVVVVAVAWALPAALGETVSKAAPRAGKIPDCSSVTPGARGRCPAACKSSSRRIRFNKCKTCALTDSYMSETLEQQLYCSKCKPGYRLLELDSFQKECVKLETLQCRLHDIERPGSAMGLSGPCVTCSKGTVPVFATNHGSWHFADTMYSAKQVCRSCKQLGCPGQCRPHKGCGSCPEGWVLLRTWGPAQSRRWIGQDPYYNVGRAPPTLPLICIKEKTLGCPGKAKKDRGCVSCPAGKVLRNVMPPKNPGTQHIRFFPAGKACA